MKDQRWHDLRLFRGCKINSSALIKKLYEETLSFHSPFLSLPLHVERPPSPVRANVQPEVTFERKAAVLLVSLAEAIFPWEN